MKQMPSLKTLIENINENIAILTVLVSGLSLLVTALFKAGTYFYYKGYYDYWRIPENYINVNYENTLYKFLVTVIVTILLLGVSNIYTFCGLTIMKKVNGYKKIVSGIVWLLSVPLFVITFLCTGLIIKFGISIKEIMIYIRYEMGSFMSEVGALWAFLWFALILCGYGIELIFMEFSKSNKEESSDKEEDDTLNQNKRLRIVLLICCVGFLVMIAWVGYTIYDAGRDSVLDRNRIDIVSIGDESYVVIDQYQDKWILKECKSVGNKFMINHDHYTIKDIIGEDIHVKFPKEGGKIEDWIVDNEEYHR